jgi:predicted helicase
MPEALRQTAYRQVVEILDPAVGTGTFIVELIDHFRGQPEKLRHKYLEELHANEVAILPYYVANLNIEATYAAIAGEYLEYPNLCFVDTLDNIAGLGIYSGHQHDMFGALSDINIERIKRQNKKKISVIIGNPPYNAWQENYNARNPNRPYRRVDDRIRVTYGKQGAAQNQNSLYDMYVRFFRWAADRLDRDGIIAFISNRNFIEKAAFDGFRKIVGEDFSDIWVVDLGGDVRANPKISGTKHNVFGIQTGVTISFLVRQHGKKGALIHYARRPEMETKEDKLSFLSSNRLSSIEFATVQPDQKHNWINLTDNDWDKLVPLIDPKLKSSKKAKQHRAIFRLMSNGLKSQRDDWVYDFSADDLAKKARYLVSTYEKSRADENYPGREAIKWDRELDKYRAKNVRKEFDEQVIRRAAFRPYVAQWLYFDRHFVGQNYQLHPLFGGTRTNTAITFLGIASSNPLASLAVSDVYDLCLLKSGNGGTQGVCRWRFADDGSPIDNVTDWAVEQFRAHYEKGKKPKRSITKDTIFHYVYGVLYDPIYREKYAQNLKREFPRIPFYADFWKWADWGEKLMALHTCYETVEQWPLERIDTKDEKSRKAGLAPKAMLKANKETGYIQLDSETQLTGVPVEAWTYRLGNRSALEWILDQYKEKKPKDPTIREKFDTYRFADYKDHVIDLLKRVTRVSVETVKITESMRKTPR